MKNVYSVYDVAKWFLNKSSMTHKKLQKLCYYAQAWHCALLDSCLFTDEIQAWVHGPVIPVLYSKYFDYKWVDIPSISDKPSFDEKTSELLEVVYNTYGQYSGDDLERLTHSEDPWIEARGNLKPWESGTEAINCDSMKNFYRKIYEQAQND